MSGTLGNLAVVLTLDSDGFTVGMNKATTAANTLKGAVDGLQGSIGKTGTSFASAGSDATAWGKALSAAASSSAASLQQATAAITAQTAASTASVAAINQQIAAVQALTRAQTQFAGIKPASGAGLGSLFDTSKLAGMAAGLAGLGTGVGVAVEAFKLLSAGIRDTIADGDKMTASLNQLQAVTGGTRDQAATMYDAITAAAIKTGTATSDLSKTTVQLMTTLGPLGQTPEQVLRIATTLAELQAVSGTSSAAATRAIREMVEGLSQGQEQLRQMRIIAQDDPALFTALAKAAGTTAGGLEEMASAGRLTSTVMVDLLNKLGANVDATFAKVPRTLEQSRTAMADSFAKLRADIDNTFGLSQTLAKWDRGLAALAQSLDDAFDRSITPKLAKAQADLTALLAIKADPQHRTSIGVSEDATDLSQQIAQQQRYVATLEAQQKAQMATLDATAQANGEATKQANVIDAATKAMAALGLEHNKTTSAAELLRNAIAAGGDALVSYNGGLVHASDLLAKLADKASPAAAELAKLNGELVQAKADAQGAFAGNWNKIATAADPLGSLGGMSDTRLRLMEAQQQIAAVQGGVKVEEAHNQLLIAQAEHMSALAGATERARQAREQFLRTYGTSPETTRQADQIYADSITASKLKSSTKTDRTGSSQAANDVAELRARLAELRASMTDGGTEVARWQAKLATANPVVRAQSAEILELARNIDAVTAAHKRREESMRALDTLRDKAAGARSDADQAQLEQGDGQRSAIQREVDRLRRTMEAAARRVQPDQQGQAQGLIATAADDTGLAAVRRAVESNQSAQLEIRKSFDDTLAARRQAAIDGVNQEAASLDQSIQLYVKNAAERQKLTAETASFVSTKMQEAYRQTESETERLGRTWGDVIGQMSSATASFASGFADATAKSLQGGKNAWRDFADSTIKELERISVQAALSPLLKAFGGASLSGLGSTLAGWVGLGGSTSGTGQSAGEIALVNAAGHHAGGLAGIERTFSRLLPPALFQQAPRYHTGGLAGDEIPAILQRGEGVFTKGQMRALGAALAVPGSVANAVSPANYNYNLTGVPANAGAGGSSSGNVVVNLHNQTGTPHNAVASAPRFDGEKMVIDIVTKAANQPGRLRTALRN